MKWFLTLALVSILAVACAGAVPTHTPVPTVDLVATVDAAVEATRTVERAVEATAYARAEATRTAAPTPTTVVVTVVVPAPTAVPVSTPEPFVAASGSVEQGIKELRKCFQNSEGFGALFALGMSSEGLSSDLSLRFVDMFVEDEELFSEAMLQAAEEDSESAVMLSLIGEMSEGLCEPEPSSSSVISEDAFSYWVVDYEDGVEEILRILKAESDYLDSELEALRHEPEDGNPDSGSGLYAEGLGMGYLEAGELLGELFDCYHSNGDVREMMDSHVRDSPDSWYVRSLLSDDRDGFVVFLRAFARQDVVGADMLAALDLELEAMCR